ncbi:MAG: hypothetical protein EXS31_05500 [Pedosphaera sp.]|nr:hypothetical protein [Pedosphaera sp.]
MPVTLNLQHLERKDLHLCGDLAPQELDADGLDELIRLNSPLHYDLVAERMDQNLVVQGTLELPIDCECVKCLKPFKSLIRLNSWAICLPLAGEDGVVAENDLADLTPWIREDILLAFPRHPLCEMECSGMPAAPQQQARHGSGVSGRDDPFSPWAGLDKLKL